MLPSRVWSLRMAVHAVWDPVFPPPASATVMLAGSIKHCARHWDSPMLLQVASSLVTYPSKYITIALLALA